MTPDDVAGPAAVSRSPTGPGMTASAASTQIFGLTPEHASITDFKPPGLAGKLRDVDVTVGGPS
jgi:hypothetical protein